MSSLYPEYEKVAEIVEKYSDLLLRVAFTYMKNISDAEDMVQEVFLRLKDRQISLFFLMGTL